MTRNLLAASRLLCLIMLMEACSVGQTTTGTVLGTVTDQTGAVVPAATITVTDEGTGARRRLTANAQGEYVATLLPIGTYTVTAEQSGFKKTVVTGTILQVNQTVRVDLPLEVGQVTETTQVTSEAPLIKTERSDVGQVIASTQITQIPLNGRSYLQLALLTPGATRMSRANGNIGDGDGIIANGASTDSNRYTLDGVEAQDNIDSRATLQPSPDAIAEFKIMTATYSAEYGRAAGANVNLAIKSGTNSFHGSAFEFLRNDNLDARNFFDGPRPLPEFKQNQFGGTLGGPIVKNKTFFFASYEGSRRKKGLTIPVILPTAAQRSGNLSSGPAIFDPLTTRTDPATGRVIRDPFPGNIIPTARISPQAQKAQQLYPSPSLDIPNQVNTVVTPTDEVSRDQLIFRVDHHLTDKDSLWGRYAQSPADQVQPTLGSSGLPGMETLWNKRTNNAVIGYTRVASPNLVNDLRIGYNRSYHMIVSKLSDRCVVCEIGISGVATGKANWGPPNINITGLTGIGAFSFSPQYPATNHFLYNDTLSWVKGAHDLRFGADILRGQMNGIITLQSRGVFSFDGRMTRNPQNALQTGQAFGDFLLGYPASSSVGLGQDDGDIRILNAGFFAQDDWKVSRSLTLNLGLRYDHMPSPVSDRDRVSIWSEADQAIILAQNNLDAPTAAIGFEGQPLRTLIKAFDGIFKFKTRDEVGLPRSIAKSSRNRAPRLGFAWRLFGNRTVLRGGWGRFYEVVGFNIELNISANPPYSRNLAFTSDLDALPTLTLANAFPGTSIQGRPGSSQGRLINWRDPYQDNFNLTLEQQIFKDSSLEIGYVGARGTGQKMSVDFNGPIFGTGTAQLRRPHPERGASGNGAVPWGHRWYDSMQAKWQTRKSNLSLLASYTYSELLTVGGGGINEFSQGARFSWNFLGPRSFPSSRISPDDPYLAIDRGPAQNDGRHRLSVAYVYTLPIGKNQRIQPPRVLDWVVGGWQLSGITTYEGGDALTPSLGADNLGGAGSSRPNLVGVPNNGPKTRLQWFTTAALTAPPSINTVIANKLDPLVAAGNSGKGVIRGPSYKTWDVGIFKNFRFTERFQVQFRSEWFNAFNHVNFGNPNTTLLTPTFGQITSAADARQIQFGLRLTF